MDAVFKTKAGVFNYRVAGVWIQDGHVLLHKNITNGQWALPGGRVEIMEESEGALQREFREELEVDVNVERLLWTTENFFSYNNKNIHEIGFYYLVTSNKIEFSLEEFYGSEGDRILVYKWMPI